MKILNVYPRSTYPLTGGWGPAEAPRISGDAIGADLAICPIQYGGGAKIKLMESLAAGLPTVAFAESIHGTNLRAGEHLLIAEPSQKALLEALRSLVRDRNLAERLSQAGRRYIVAHHDWAKSAVKLETALLQVVESGNRSSTSQRSSTVDGQMSRILDSGGTTQVCGD